MFKLLQNIDDKATLMQVNAKKTKLVMPAKKRKRRATYEVPEFQTKISGLMNPCVQVKRRRLNTSNFVDKL